MGVSDRRPRAVRSFEAWSDAVIDHGLLPTWLARMVIDRLLSRRLARLYQGGLELCFARERSWIATLRNSPIAEDTKAANREHYEVTSEFFRTILGPHWKYSCALWDQDMGLEDLGRAEEHMLAVTAQRADISDGQAILDLGCGWGAFTIYAASRYPHARVIALSNSASQAETVRERARRDGLENVEVITADINTWEPSQRFDRIVSVELFEHLRNYEILLRRLARWLQPDGKLFVHHFAHREWSYPFETEGPTNWMGRWFFTGGQMPSADLLLSFQEDMRIVERWAVDGRHYAKTLRAWRRNMERSRRDIVKIFGGGSVGHTWYHRWYLFLLACEGLFDYADGQEWYVVHSVFHI